MKGLHVAMQAKELKKLVQRRLRMKSLSTNNYEDVSEMLPLSA